VDKASCPCHRKSPHSLLDEKSGTSYMQIKIYLQLNLRPRRRPATFNYKNNEEESNE
jgi:hypothetical protein